MVGPVLPSSPAPPTKPPTVMRTLSSSERIWRLAAKLATCARLEPPHPHHASFYHLCILLSREIDFATASNEVPDRVSELPGIFKLVCQRMNVCSLQAAIMALMASVKNACKAQWFSGKESQELLSLANEVFSIFSTPEGFSCDQANIISNVSQIMSRYYPWLKLGHILASVSIKPGFEACAVDVHISKNLKISTLERIRLLVAVKDNTDTSSCIISPPKVNILLNGVGLQERSVGCMYGPQLPTIVNPMLRYGTNLLQAIGHFDAHYIVLVAVMSDIPISDLPAPHDYVQPPEAAVDSDAEVIEGPSKVSLNCPISFTRITKPVKGYLCKHIQCFDLSNYILINSKRPSWRCPQCNQPVCHPDIRIDKKMLKILQEVGEGVTNVIIHSDGSWEATSDSNEHNDEPHANAFEGLQLNQPEPPGPSNICDLTEVDEEMISLDVDEPADRKPVVSWPVVQPAFQSTPIHTNPSVPSVSGEPSQVNQNSATQVQGISSLGPFGNHCGPADYSTRANPEARAVPAAPAFEHFTTSTMLTDSVPPAANREQQASLGQMMNYAIARDVGRMPVAMQALPPMRMPTPRSLLYSRPPFMNNLPQNSSGFPLNTSLPLPTVSNGADTVQRDFIQQQYISLNQLGSQMQQFATAQMRGFRAPVQVPGNAFIAPPGLQAPSQPQLANHMSPQMVYMPPHPRARTQVPPGGSVRNINQTTTADQWYPRMEDAVQQTRLTQMQDFRPSSGSMPAPAADIMNVLPEFGPSPDSGGTLRVSRTEDLLDVQSEKNWQPTKRMRGSLTGQAYNEALDQFMIRPTQTTPSPSAQPCNQTIISPQLQALLANRNLHTNKN